jgi:hypothetical protein
MSSLSLSVTPTNSDQLGWVPDAFDFIWKTEETIELILDENGSEDSAKPRISNQQLSVNSRTLRKDMSHGN